MKLSCAQLKTLEAVAKGDAFAGCRRQCDYGGRVTSLWSLKRRGLLSLENNWAVTEEGRKFMPVAK